MQSAKIILDSISPDGYRLTTFELRFWLAVHNELMTHRKFSRNASSSRAIPTQKLLKEVRDPALRAMPVFWGMNRPGMQATDAMTPEEQQKAEAEWDKAANMAADQAEVLLNLGLHKQLVNRLLAPFLHINVVVSATDYMNFFGLRLDKGAQPEMRALAEHMWSAYINSEPQELDVGEWHLPYIDDSDRDKASLDDLIKISVARCARVSYRSFETGKRSTMQEDILLHDRLLCMQPIHASPAEHIATPDMWLGNNKGWMTPEEHGNFEGWRQYRKTIEGEDLAKLPAEYQQQLVEHNG